MVNDKVRIFSERILVRLIHSLVEPLDKAFVRFSRYGTSHKFP
jgi:hypothetical protein